MLKIEQRAQIIKGFVENVYKVLGCADARSSAVFIEDGREVSMTALSTAEPAMVTVDDKGKVEILLRKSVLYLDGMFFDLLKGMIKIGMKESGYSLQREQLNQETFVFLEFSF